MKEPVNPTSTHLLNNRNKIYEDIALRAQKQPQPFSDRKEPLAWQNRKNVADAPLDIE